jgi:capsular exopolysaccharide synthesis family protein
MARARERRRSVLAQGTPPDASPTHVAFKPRAGTVSWKAVPEIPFVSARARRFRITAPLGGKEAAAYDLLRSRTLKLMGDRGWKRVAVTSPEAASGKSTVALNLALALARQRDLRVMLFDADFRRPSLHKIIGHSPSHSMHEVLAGKFAFADIATRIGSNLIVGLNADAAENPAELFQAQRAREVLDEIQRDWRPDIMIFDTPPMLATDDHVSFLPRVDCGILVAAAERSRLANIDYCEKELGQLTNVLGIVLNKCRYPDEGAGYAYDE